MIARISAGLLSLIAACVILLLAMVAGSRFSYQKGVDALTAGYSEKAMVYLGYAEKILPTFLSGGHLTGDIYRIRLAQGDAQCSGASDTDNRDHALKLLENGYRDYSTATLLMPSSYIAWHKLARSMAKIEMLRRAMRKKPERQYADALGAYRNAAGLRPEGVTIHYEMLKYMAANNIRDGFDELAAYTVQISPGSWRYLVKESFFSDHLKSVLKEGVLKAAEEGVTPRTTYQILSLISSDEKDFSKAAFYYGESMRFSPNLNSYNDFLTLGNLYLLMKDYRKAGDIFLDAIKLCTNLEYTIDRIYACYKRVGEGEKFMSLASAAEELFRTTPESLDIAKARCCMDMGLYGVAGSILTRRNAISPSVKTYALLAEIGCKLKNWDEMELAAHRATVLDPDNPYYWILFSTALKKQGKIDQAHEIDLKIRELSTTKMKQHSGLKVSRKGSE